MAYEFTAAESVNVSFARTSREQLDRATHELSEELAADPVAAIHAARKAIKKERALLRMVRGSLAGRDRRKANATLRTAARRLSGARDPEVMIQTLNGLAERFAGQLPETTFTTVRERLERERDLQIPTAQLLEQTVEDLRAVRLSAERWQLSKEGWRAVEAGLARTYKDGRKAFRRSQKRTTVKARHAWRKRVKDLWYELRLLGPVCGPMVRGYAEEAEQLGELLGAEHDLGVLKEGLRRVAPEVAVDVDAPVALADYRRDQLRTQAGFIASRLYAEKPRVFARRLRRCWEAGQAEHRAFEARHPAVLARVTRTST